MLASMRSVTPVGRTQIESLPHCAISSAELMVVLLRTTVTVGRPARSAAEYSPWLAHAWLSAAGAVPAVSSSSEYESAMSEGNADRYCASMPCVKPEFLKLVTSKSGNPDGVGGVYWVVVEDETLQG